MLSKNKKEIELLNKLEKEILTPITFIQGYSALLKNSFELPNEAVSNINKIDKASERVLSSVQFILLDYEIKNSKQKTNLEEIPVLSTVYEVISKFIRLAKTRKINFTFSGQNTSKVFTNKKFFTQSISVLSQEILLALEKGNVDVLIKKEGGDILIIYKVVFDQKKHIDLSKTPGFLLANTMLNKSKNKITFTKRDSLQTISLRLNIVG